MQEKKKGTILVTLRKREEVQFWTSLMDPWPEEAEENKMVIDDDEYSELMVIASKWEAICEILRGEEVSDFLLGFPEVRQVSDMVGYGGVK